MVVLRGEVTPDGGRHTEDGKEIRGDHLDANALGLAGTGQTKVVRAIGRDSCKRAVIALPVDKIRVADGRLCKGRRAGVERNQMVRVRIRQGTEQDAIHDRKERGIRADSKRQRQDRDGRESRGLR